MFIPWGRWSNLTTVQYFSNGLVQPPPSYELGPSSTMPSSRRFHLGLGHWFWSFSRESFGIARGVQKGKVGHRFWYDQGLFQHVFFCFVFFFLMLELPIDILKQAEEIEGYFLGYPDTSLDENHILCHAQLWLHELLGDFGIQTFRMPMPIKWLVF